MLKKKFKKDKGALDNQRLGSGFESWLLGLKLTLSRKNINTLQIKTIN